MRCDKDGLEVFETTADGIFIVADTKATCGIAVYVCTKYKAHIDGTIREAFRILQGLGNVKTMRGVKQRATKYLACDGIALA